MDDASRSWPRRASSTRYRHDGLWLTVNTPKDLRVADEHVRAHPDWLATVGCTDMNDHLSSPTSGGFDAFGFEPTQVEKPWGRELIWAQTDDYCGKLLFVKAGHALTLQFHREKDESWYVHRAAPSSRSAGPGDAIPNSEVVGPGAAFRLPPGHGPPGPALEDTPMLEVSTPHLDDVVRLEDRYGRASASLTQLW